MVHSELCECKVCEGTHPKLVKWRMGHCKVTSVELREGTWYVNYEYTTTNRGKTLRMKLYEWNIQAIQYGNSSHE